MNEKKSGGTVTKVLLGVGIGILISYGAAVYWYNKGGGISKDRPQQNTPQEAQQPQTLPPPPTKVTCQDVTSYDYNWDNDVLCTNPDGSTFYTNYSGANKYGYSF